MPTAVGIPNVIIWAFYFWKKDVEEDYYLKNPDYYIRQSFQKLIYRLNQPFLRIDQSSFTNVSIFDRYYIESLFGGVVYPDGTCVIDYIDEIIEHQKIFMQVVSEIRKQNMFTFPVLTYSLLKKKVGTPESIKQMSAKPGFNPNEWMTESEIAEMRRTKQYHVFVDEDFARWCSDHNTVWNDSNFFMSTDCGVLSNCCRLLSDTQKLQAFINSIGGTALSIGSVKVNTINLMRIVYEADEWVIEHYGTDIAAGKFREMRKDKYIEILRKRVLLCCKTLDVQRHIINRNIQKGLLPNFCAGGVEMDKCYSTVGILGLYEAVEALDMTTLDDFGNRYYTQEGIDFASTIFEVINDVKDSFNNDKHAWIKVDTNIPQYADLKINYSFNCESVPGERCAVIFCQKDNALYSESDIYNPDRFIYSNQWIPLSQQCTLKEKLRVCSILDQKCSGGAIAHINLEANFPNTDAAWINLNEIALSDVIYFAYNTRINECKNHHAFLGDHCDVCGEPVFDTYQRIVGYLVPTRSYSKDRKREFNSRLWFEYAQTLME